MGDKTNHYIAEMRGLNGTQANVVGLCVELLVTASDGEISAELVMLDHIAALILFDIFTARKLGDGMNAEAAAAQHANYVMEIMDRIHVKEV